MDQQVRPYLLFFFQFLIPLSGFQLFRSEDVIVPIIIIRLGRRMEIFILKNVLRLVLNILNLVKIFSFEVLVVSIFYLANGTSNQWTHLGDLGPF